MRSLIVTDGPARYSVSIHDVYLPEISAPMRPAHLLFLEWWQDYCKRVHLPAPSKGPESISVIKQLLKHYSRGKLCRLAVHFFLDHGQMLRENPHHFAIFASMVRQMQEELDAREG